MTYHSPIDIFKNFTSDSDGNIFRRQRGNPQQPAGYLRKDGNIAIRLSNKLYLAHQLVWLLNTGTWSKFKLSHKDNNRTNNRFENLVETHCLCNARKHK